MDQTLLEYRRKWVIGDGSIEEYLRLAARAGISRSQALSEYVAGNLNNHHRRIVNLHLDNPTSANFSSMGGNNKIPTVETIRVLMKVRLIKKCLIIAPASQTFASRLMQPHRHRGSSSAWSKAFKEQAPELTVATLEGNSHNKAHQLSQDFQVFITSYSSLPSRSKPSMPGGMLGYLSLADLLSSKKWDLIVLDEVHYIKNPQAKRSKICYALGDKTRYRIALTAVPVSNSLTDIWGPFRFINPEIFGKHYSHFLNIYFVRSRPLPFPASAASLYLSTIEGGVEPKKGSGQKIVAKLKQAKGIRW